MKTLYYQGRIAQDKKDQNGAAVFYSRAEAYSDLVTDRHALGVLYLAEATIYNTVHNLEKEKVEKLHLTGKPDEQLFLCCCLLDLPTEMVAARFNLTNIFDWEGNLNRIIRLPEKIGAFCVNGTSLYGTIEHPDRSVIVEYEIN